MSQRAGTHGARLHGDEELAAFEAMIAQGSSSFAQSDNLGVGTGVGVGQIAVPAASYDAVIEHDDGTDGHLARIEGALGAAEGFFHPHFVGIGHRSV